MPEEPVAITPMTEARYVFAVAELSRPYQEVGSGSGSGFGGQPVRTMGPGRLKAVVQTCHPGFLAGASAEALATAVLHHHRIIQSMMEFAHSLVPCRFGTLVDGDDTAVSRWLAAAAPELQPALARVRGCWEAAVTVERMASAATGADGPGPGGASLPSARVTSVAITPNTAPGTAFLLDRMARESTEHFREKQNVRLRAELLESIAPLVKEWLPELVQGPDVVARFTFLVPQGNLADFTAKLQAAVEARLLTVTQQQVLPPYSFAAWGPAGSEVRRGR